MNFPQEIFSNLISDKGIVLPWSTKLAHALIVKNTADKQSLRSSERVLKAQLGLPETLSLGEVRTETHFPLNLTIAENLDQQIRDSRSRSLILQSYLHVKCGLILVSNDARGGRKWVYLDKNPSLEEIKSALVTLADGKSAMFWPHGKITLKLRQIFEQLPSYKFSASNEQWIGSGLIAYPHADSNHILESNSAVMNTTDTNFTHLERLEAESIHIIREVVAQAENPVMLYSIGKDSAVMLHLARKAFHPAPLPFPLLHVDTRWKFQEMYRHRQALSEQDGINLIVHVNPEGVKNNVNPFDHGSALHTDIMKTQGLKQALDEHKFDVAFGGARRDEEKSRAKERVFSFRNPEHRWDPKNQRPELWSLYNGYKREGESIRAFPLSNWTELDIWQYIYQENIQLVPLYFAKERPVIERDGMLIMIDDDRIKLRSDEKIQLRKVRFRTLGCYPLTGAVDSEATDLQGIVLELVKSRVSERQGRAIDSDTSASMEKKKQEGYF